MVRIFRVLLLSSCIILALQAHSWAQEEENYLTLQNRIIDVFKENRAAVFKVYTSVKNPNETDKNILRIGTGFFISKKGLILTTAKTTAQANRIWIEYDGVEYVAEPVGYDLLTNISLIQISTLPKDFKHISLNSPPSLPDEGSIMISIASQLGLPPGPIMGMVTGRNVRYGNMPLPTVYIRANISTGSGEGGSPVFDLSGQIVGITVATLPEIRSCFILPVKAIKRVRDDIIYSGSPRYALFGLFTKEIADAKHGRKIVIDKVIEKSPASTTDLRSGDVLLKIGEYEIKNEHNLRNAFFFTSAEQLIAIKVKRKEKILDFTFRVGTHKPEHSGIQKIEPSDKRKPTKKETASSKFPGHGVIKTDQLKHIKK